MSDPCFFKGITAKAGSSITMLGCKDVKEFKANFTPQHDSQKKKSLAACTLLQKLIEAKLQKSLTPTSLAELVTKIRDYDLGEFDVNQLETIITNRIAFFNSDEFSDLFVDMAGFKLVIEGTMRPKKGDKVKS